MHYRKEYRDFVKAALSTESTYEDFTVLPAWAQNISARDLPVIGVATPTEAKDLLDHGTSVRQTRLLVLAKMVGGDEIEDTLDDLSDSLERSVMSAVNSEKIECLLTGTSIEVDAGGENRVGSLTMEFSVTKWLVEPLTD